VIRDGDNMAYNLHALAEMLSMTVGNLMRDMTTVELQGWFDYFERRDKKLKEKHGTHK
jgi:hypothetical protein